MTEEEETNTLWRAVGWDVWGRPDGPWKGATSAVSQYDMGGRLLLRGRDVSAKAWLTRAADAGHPGAYFRLALICLRWGLVTEALDQLHDASERGHEDADALIGAWDFSVNQPPYAVQTTHILDAVDAPQDPIFAAEVAHLLARRLPPV